MAKTTKPTEPAKPDYDESAIKEVEFPYNVRKRPGMYVGKLGNGKSHDDGIYLLTKEAIDNGIDEFRMNCGKEIFVEIFEKDGLEGLKISDEGRGIPHGSLVLCVTKLHAGAKFDSVFFQKSSGMNGIGLKAANALSIFFEASTTREGKTSTATFSEGLIQNESSTKADPKEHGTSISFIPDPKKFGDFIIAREYIQAMMARYACLNVGLTLTLTDHTDPKNPITFQSERGLVELLETRMEEGGEKTSILYNPIVLKDPENPDIEIVITHGSHYGEEVHSFVNGQFTVEGGTHVAAFREGLTTTIRDFFGRKFDAADIRTSLITAIAIRIQEPIFESQTKIKLGSSHTMPALEDGTPEGETLRTFIGNFLKKELNNFLHKNPKTAEALKSKILANELERKELAGIRDKVRKANKTLSIANRKLKDCRVHLNSKAKAHQEHRLLSTIFITEGDSASGSITQIRDANTQAVFSLKGKPTNTYGKSRRAIYDNEELHMLVDALGMEDSLENLRFNNVILATDADADGMHIRILMLSFFLQYFPEIIKEGHLYILQTPLFRVRNKKETRYCYSENERDKAVTSLGNNPEVTRFKGLGEISPKEFKGFIGEKIRLEPVRLDKDSNPDEIRKFYMGENTPERKQFICENLLPLEEA